MKKWVISIITVGLIASLVSLFYFSKVSVTAQGDVLSGQSFRASFSSTVEEDAWVNGDLYLVNQQGTKIDAEHALSAQGKSLEIMGLEEGSYTLYVKNNLGIGKTKFSFDVYKEIPFVKSEKDLKTYFELVRKVHGQEQTITVSDGAAIEESRSDEKDSSSAGGDYSTTNNQVEGVDEADTVKTNGTHVFSISENNVVIINIEDPKNMKEESKIRFADEFYPTQLLLADQTLMIIGQKNMYHTLEKESANMDRTLFPVDSMTGVYFYDISNPATPKLGREIATEGYMNGARLNNNTLYYVTTVYPNFWMVEGSEDPELRPFIYDSKGGDKVIPLPYADISILPNTLEGIYSVITAIDVANPVENKVVTKGYLGGSEQLYMSKDSLYLTSSIYEPSNSSSNKIIWRPGTIDTEVFKFVLNKTNVQFVGSERLTGSILNQFSMDEYNGYFRAVTTKGDTWNENEPSENNLFILDKGMKVVGSITGLAKEERIYSARFMGEKAYMVTFKETDPLFVIDISTPSAPKVLGELKIPGFSNYLHPLDDNHLIGFGYETKSVVQPGSKDPVIMTGGMKVSLFDVSDFTNPKEVDTEVIGGQGTYSSIQYDHHALFQHREKNLYGFPVTIYEQTEGQEYSKFKQDGALVYEITPAKGIVLKGDLLNPENPVQQYEEWESSIGRMIYVEDFLYTIAMKEIVRYNLNTFKQMNKLAY